MANTIITNQYIANKAVALVRNSNAFLTSVDRQYDPEFERTGTKPGQSIRIRQPVDYVLRSGAVASPQDTTTNSLTFTASSQIGVDMQFTSVDRTQFVERFNEIFITPAVNVVVGGLASATMSATEGQVSRMSVNWDGSGALVTPSRLTYLNARAALQNSAAPYSNYKSVVSPFSNASIVDGLAGSFNSQRMISKQYETGDMTDALGLEWISDQTVLMHTSGSLAASPTFTAGKGWTSGAVSGANQTGSTLTVSAMGGTLKKGDVIVIDGVFEINPVTKAASGKLRQFTVTADVAASATTIPISPGILVGNVQYGTVSASPANSAVIYSLVGPNVTYRRNLVYIPKAITLATVDLEMPGGGAEGARSNYDGISVRVVTMYDVTNDKNITRLDLLSGALVVKPDWCVVVPDPIG